MGNFNAHELGKKIHSITGRSKLSGEKRNIEQKTQLREGVEWGLVGSKGKRGIASSRVKERADVASGKRRGMGTAPVQSAVYKGGEKRLRGGVSRSGKLGIFVGLSKVAAKTGVIQGGRVERARLRDEGVEWTAKPKEKKKSACFRLGVIEKERGGLRMLQGGGEQK